MGHNSETQIRFYAYWSISKKRQIKDDSSSPYFEKQSIKISKNFRSWGGKTVSANILAQLESEWAEIKNLKKADKQPFL